MRSVIGREEELAVDARGLGGAGAPRAGDDVLDQGRRGGLSRSCCGEKDDSGRCHKRQVAPAAVGGAQVKPERPTSFEHVRRGEWRVQRPSTTLYPGARPVNPRSYDAGSTRWSSGLLEGRSGGPPSVPAEVVRSITSERKRRKSLRRSPTQLMPEAHPRPRGRHGSPRRCARCYGGCSPLR